MEVLSYHETHQLLIAHTGVDPELAPICDPATYRAEVANASEAERAAGRSISGGVATEADLQTFIGLITRASVRACHACVLAPDEQLHRYEAARLAIFVEDQGRMQRAFR